MTKITAIIINLVARVKRITLLFVLGSVGFACTLAGIQYHTTYVGDPVRRIKSVFGGVEYGWEYCSNMGVLGLGMFLACVGIIAVVLDAWQQYTLKEMDQKIENLKVVK